MDIAEYIRVQLRERGLSGRAAARAMGVSTSHFARVAAGRIKRPDAGFCVKLARLFEDSPITVLRLAGWLPDDNDDVLLEEVRGLVARDRRLLNILRNLLPEDRQLLTDIAEMLARYRAGESIRD